MLLSMLYRNPGVPTLEGAFFEALVKAGAISEDNSDDHQKVRTVYFASQPDPTLIFTCFRSGCPALHAQTQAYTPPTMSCRSR